MCAMIRRPVSLENALLGFLNQSPQHGYQLHQQLCDLSGLGLVWRIKQSRLYALLDKFEKLGLITHSLQYDESHPPRKVFSLTEDGRKIYESWIVTPVKRPHLMRQEYMAKSYFALNESPSVILTLFERQREECNKWLLALELDQQVMNNHHSFSMLVNTYRTGQVRAIIDWLEKCLIIYSK